LKVTLDCVPHGPVHPHREPQAFEGIAFGAGIEVAFDGIFCSGHDSVLC